MERTLVGNTVVGEDVRNGENLANRKDKVKASGVADGCRSFFWGLLRSENLRPLYYNPFVACIFPCEPLEAASNALGHRCLWLCRFLNWKAGKQSARLLYTFKQPHYFDFASHPSTGYHTCIVLLRMRRRHSEVQDSPAMPFA